MVDSVVDTTTAEPDNPTVVIDDVAEQQSTETVALPEEHGESAGAPTEDVEREAREAGWVPQDQWKGDPRKWRSAETYIETRNHVLPLVQKENKSLRAQLDAMRTEVARLAQAEQERQVQREQLSIDTLKMQRRQALEENDHERLTEIDSKLMDAAIRQRTTPAPQQRMNPEVQRIWTDFQEENTWVKDPKMEQVLREKMVLMRQAGSTLLGRELLDEATDRVKREYPEKFGRANRAAMSESGGFNGSSREAGAKVSWSDLKPEVRDAYDQYLSTEKGMTKQKFLENCAQNPKEYFRNVRT